MSSAKNRLIAILFGILVLSVLSSSVNATEYNSTVLVASGSYFDSPKIACKSADECIMVVHNNNTNYLTLYYTQTGFSSINASLSFAAWTPDYTVVRSNYSHVFDVSYLSTGKFYITNKRTLYEFNTSTSSVSTVCTIADDDFYFAGIYNSTQTIALRVMTAAADLNAYFVNTTCDTVSTTLIGSLGSFGGFASPTSFTEASGFIDWKSTIATTADIVANIKAKYGTSAAASFTSSLGTFPDTYTGMWGYVNNKVYYRNSTFIKTASTTNFVAWGTPVDYFVNAINVETESRVHYSGFDVVAYENSTGVYFGNSFESPTYTPAKEYTDANIVYNPTFWWSGARALSPKVACEPDMQHCLMLVYDNTYYFGGLIGIYSIDGFATAVSWPIANSKTFYVFKVPTVDLSSEVANTNLADSSFPYDVYYDGVSGDYYLMTSYSTDNAIRYRWNIYSGLISSAFSFTSHVPSRQWATWKPLDIKMEGSDPVAVILENYCYASAFASCNGSIAYHEYYLLNGTKASSSEIFLSNSSVCVTAVPSGITSLGGMAVDLPYNGYSVKGNFGCNSDQSFDTLQPLFPTTSLGYDYYRENSDFVYKRSASAGVSEGNWYTSTNDFVTYSSPVLRYAWDKSQGETIPRTDRVLLSSKRVYVFERNHYTNYGIFAYREDVYPIYVFGRYSNPITGETDLPVNQSVTLTCPSGYTTSDIDSNSVVYTTCDTAMNMSIYTAGFIPTSGQITFDKATGCTSSMTMLVNYLPQTYSPNITVRDVVTGDPISGATVKIDGLATYTTNYEGKAQLTSIAPIQSPYFTQSVSSCTINLNVAGTPRSYWIQTSKSGYRTTNTYNFQFAESGSYLYKTESALNVYLDRGAEVIVRVYTSDGVEVAGNLVSVTGLGSNLTYILLSNVPVQTNTSTSFPATYRLVDGRSSFTENFTLVQGSYSQSQLVTIFNTTNYYTVSFTLPTVSTSQPCSTNLDCTQSYCTGNFFHDLTSCTGGYCAYDVESCVLCDSDAGCFNTETSATCNFDSECYGQIVCLSTAVLQDSRCGSDNKCVLAQTQCAYGCEEGVCKPAPADVQCDQSTTLGMLQCMQSGMMNFIGSTYNQIFAIFIVLFIAVIIGLVLTTAFKGVERVV